MNKTLGYLYYFLGNTYEITAQWLKFNYWRLI